MSTFVGYFPIRYWPLAYRPALSGADDAASTGASTKRQPAVSGGKVSAPVTYLTGLLIVPLLPVTPETVNTVQLESPREAKETFIFSDSANDLPDIIQGDILVTGGNEYVIRSVAEYDRDWPEDGGSFLHLVVEEQKGS